MSASTMRWTCNICWCVNNPYQGKLAEVPALKCRGSHNGAPCTAWSRLVYEWRVTDASFTRPGREPIYIDLPVFHQGGGCTCGCYACVTAVLLMYKLHHAWMEHIVHSVVPNHRALIVKYDQLHKHTYPVDPDKNTPVRDSMKVAGLLDIIQDEGVPLLTADGVAHPERNLKIRDFTRVLSSVEEMTYLIADGKPLVGHLPVGRLWFFTRGTGVYYAPILERDSAGKIMNKDIHAVVLIGSGLAHKPGTPSDQVGTYFVARNSYGPTAHPTTNGESFNGQAVGGEFVVWADDLFEVYQIHIAVANYLPKP